MAAWTETDFLAAPYRWNFEKTPKSAPSNSEACMLRFVKDELESNTEFMSHWVFRYFLDCKALLSNRKYRDSDSPRKTLQFMVDDMDNKRRWDVEGKPPVKNLMGMLGWQGRPDVMNTFKTIFFHLPEELQKELSNDRELKMQIEIFAHLTHTVGNFTMLGPATQNHTSMNSKRGRNKGATQDLWDLTLLSIHRFVQGKNRDIDHNLEKALAWKENRIWLESGSDYRMAVAEFDEIAHEGNVTASSAEDIWRNFIERYLLFDYVDEHYHVVPLFRRNICASLNGAAFERDYRFIPCAKLPSTKESLAEYLLNVNSKIIVRGLRIQNILEERCASQESEDGANDACPLAHSWKRLFPLSY